MPRRSARWVIGLAIALLPGRPGAAAGDEPKAEAFDGAAVERVRQAVMLIGHPGYAGGTGFVVSRRHRLVATSARVADIRRWSGPMRAVHAASGTTYFVERAWYHPGVLRILDEGLVARSDDPKDGRVAFGGPDVAVVQLAAGGPALPGECALANPDEANDLVGRPLSMFGFHSGITEMESFWHHPIPDLTRGVVRRSLAFDGSAAKPGRPAALELWINGGPGDGGAPLFLANGRVAAIATAPFDVIIHPATSAAGTSFLYRAIEPADPRESDPARPDGPAADHVDVLRELLAFHKLDRLVPLGTTASVRPFTDPVPDPRLARYRRAMARVRDAKRLKSAGDLAGAGAACNEALTLAPSYAAALILRGEVYLDFCRRRWPALTPDDRLSWAERAVKDALRAAQFQPSRTRRLLILVQSIQNLAGPDGDPRLFRLCESTVTTVLTSPRPSIADRALAHLCRAEARDHLGDAAGSEADFKTAAELSPDGKLP